MSAEVLTADQALFQITVSRDFNAIALNLVLLMLMVCY